MCDAAQQHVGQIVDPHSFAIVAWPDHRRRGQLRQSPSAYRLIVESACHHRTIRRMVCMEAMARASTTEASNDVLATTVRADEVVAMDAERTLVE
jgi:hypothetical protein